MASYKQIDFQNWQVSFYCKDYYGVNKKIKKRGFKTKTEAREYYNTYIAKTKGTGDIKLVNLFEEFFKYKEPLLKHNTKRNYKDVLRKIKNAPIGEIPLKDLELKHYILFLKDFRLNPSVYKKVKDKLKSCLDYAMIHYGLKENIFINFKNDCVKTEKKEKEIITFEEFKKIDELVKEKNLQELRCFINLLYYTGARPGEILALTLEDIDINNRLININKTRLNKNLYNTPKTNSSKRIISIPNVIVPILKEHIKTLPKIKSGFLFKIFKNRFDFDKIKKN